jgi:anaerobic dimethyl sulfoxide reductase subunit B (iron-sulfur subunit)
MQYAFYFDQTSCNQCGTCVVACKDWNDVKPGPVKWRQIHEHEFKEQGEFPNVSYHPLVYSCNHCSDPVCVTSCAVGAISKGSDGIVTLDRNKCQRLQLCIAACPYGAPQLAEDKQEPEKSSKWLLAHPAQKCTFCPERWKDGKKPICVDACPQRALDAGTVDYILQQHPEAVPATEAAGFPSDVSLGKHTKPNLYIKLR